MAKKSQTKKEVVQKLRRVMGVMEIIDGKTHLFCPECDETPTIGTVDYDMTNDGKYTWFIYHCPRCKVHVVHFVDGKIHHANVGHLYDVYGRNLEDKANKKANATSKPVKQTKRLLPQKVANHKKKLSLPDLD